MQVWLRQNCCRHLTPATDGEPVFPLKTIEEIERAGKHLGLELHVPAKKLVGPNSFTALFHEIEVDLLHVVFAIHEVAFIHLILRTFFEWRDLVLREQLEAPLW